MLDLPSERQVEAFAFGPVASTTVSTPSMASSAPVYRLKIETLSPSIAFAQTLSR